MRASKPKPMLRPISRLWCCIATLSKAGPSGLFPSWSGAVAFALALDLAAGVVSALDTSEAVTLVDAVEGLVGEGAGGTLNGAVIKELSGL